MIREISPKELLEWRKSGRPHQLIDVREEYEVETCTIGGLHIPMNEVYERIGEIRSDIPVVIHCKSGRRSSAVTHALASKFAFDNVYTLRGGIIAWIEEVDSSIAHY